MFKSGKWMIGAAMTGLVLSGATLADDEFCVQAQGHYGKTDIEDVPDDVDACSLSGTYYLAPVSTTDVPVGEAAYINRASFVSVMASRVELGDADAKVLAAEFGYHVPDTIFFGRVGVARAEVDDGTVSDDDTTWNGTVGIVPIPRLFFGTDFTEDGYDPNITARYVAKLSNSHWLAGSISAVDPDEGDTEYSAQVDYYFPSFKLGGGFNSLGDQWSVRAEKGLPHGFALQGDYFTDEGSDGFGIQLTWRDL